MREFQKQKEKHFQELVESIKPDEARLQKLEIQNEHFKGYDQRIKQLSAQLTQVVHACDETKEMQLFVERTQPLLTHVALVDGLH